jgi:hypothetical protein
MRYVEKPLRDMPELQGEEFVEVDGVDYIEPDDTRHPPITAQHLIDRAMTTYDHIAQSLNEGQINHIRTVYVGNAYLLMKRLKDNYGAQISPASQISALQQLQVVRRSPSEPISDCFARIDRLLNDYNAQSPSEPLPKSELQRITRIRFNTRRGRRSLTRSRRRKPPNPT